jgi:hypothetical protein
MREALIEASISLSYCKGLEGKWKVWLTRESGSAPGEGVPCVAHAFSSAVNARRAYIVVQYERRAVTLTGGKWEVAITQLCEQGVDAVTDAINRALPGLDGMDAARFIVAVSLGRYRRTCGSGVPWNTGPSHGCDLCEGHSGDKARFVRQDKYCGLYPVSAGHWFRGVTDAVCKEALWLVYGYSRTQHPLPDVCEECFSVGSTVQE